MDCLDKRNYFLFLVAGHQARSGWGSRARQRRRRGAVEWRLTRLCYVPAIGWIAAIVVLASQRFRSEQTVRFHAFQGLYLFVAWLMNDHVLNWALAPVSHLHLNGLISLALLVMSIFMMVKASHDEAYSLPLFGVLAQRSLSER